MGRNTRYQPFLVLGSHLLLSGLGILIWILAGKFRIARWSQTLMDKFDIFELSLLFATLPIAIVAVWTFYRRRSIGPLPILVSVFVLGPVLGTIAINPLIMVAYHPEMSYWAAFAGFISWDVLRYLFQSFLAYSDASFVAGLFAMTSVLAVSEFLRYRKTA